MRRFKLNHWFINDNQLSISLMRYYVDIDMTVDDDDTSVILRVVDSNRKELFFDFDSMETAVAFTEAVIDKCSTYNDIEEAYNKYYSEDMPKTFVK